MTRATRIAIGLRRMARHSLKTNGMDATTTVELGKRADAAYVALSDEEKAHYLYTFCGAGLDGLLNSIREAIL